MKGLPPEAGRGTAGLTFDRLATDSPLWPRFVQELTDAGLPTADLGGDSQLYFVLQSAGDPIGYGGYERYGPEALLRSLVVTAEHRSAGAGRKIVRSLVERLRRDRAKRVWLLTDTAPDFFEKLGFARQPRLTAPATIASTREFASLCPASAVLMCLNRL